MSYTLYTAYHVGGAINHISFILAAPAPGSAGTATPSTSDTATGSGGASAPAPALPTNTTTTPTTFTTYNVTGAVLAGMAIRIRASHPWPECDPEFIPGSLKYIRRIDTANLGRRQELCRAVEPPPKQLKLNDVMIDKSKEAKRCTWWVQEIMGKAKVEGVVRE